MTDILDDLNKIPWADLEHAYGSASDVPGLLRRLLVPDPKVRSETMNQLYGNVFHQGTRYPATPYVIPFLIRMCADPAVPKKQDLIHFWGSLIVGYFNVQERPLWGNGAQIFWGDEIQNAKEDDPYTLALHQIYKESVNGFELLCTLLEHEEIGARANAAWVLACMQTKSQETIPILEARLKKETSGWVRAAFAFTFGELNAPNILQRMFDEDPFAAVRCMAACQLSRIRPIETLVEPLIQFVSQRIDGYEDIPGAGGKSTDDAAFAISYLPTHVQQKAIPAICDRLEQARMFDTIPLASTLLSAAFPASDHEISELSNLQKYVLIRMVKTEEPWRVGYLHSAFKSVGLPGDRKKCAQLVGIEVSEDKALDSLRSGLNFAHMGFLELGRKDILEALEMDPNLFERVPAADESLLLCAKAFAETDPERAIDAYRRTIEINPWIANKVNPTWHLANLLKEHKLI